MLGQIERSADSHQLQIAFDSTKLISADSFLIAEASELRDPFAAEDFRFVVDAFCNETAPYFASPTSGKKQPHATPLLGTWQDAAVRGDTIPVSLDDEKIFATMAPLFANEANAHAAQIAHWMQYQFSHEDLVEIFWEGGNTTTKLELALGHIEQFLPEEHLLCRALLHSRFPIDNRFYSKYLRDKRTIGIAYAFFAFRKGRDYVYKLPDGPLYVPHWLRATAQPGHDEDAKETQVVDLPDTFFPWGDIFIRLLSHPSSGFQIKTEKLPAMLQHVRRATINQKPYLERHYQNPQARVEDFIITTLHDAGGWIPPPNQRLNTIAGLVGAIVKEAAKIWLPPAVATQAGLPPNDLVSTISVRGAIETISYVIAKKVLAPGAFSVRRQYARLNANALAPYRPGPLGGVAKLYLARLADPERERS